MLRVAAGIPGARLRVFRDRDRPDTFVTLGEWPDPAAFQAFATHPDLAGATATILANLAEAYPTDKPIFMDELTA